MQKPSGRCWQALVNGTCAVAVSGLLVGTPVRAQQQDEDVDAGASVRRVEDAATAAAEKREVEEVLVTGSRIRRKDLSSPAPVTILSRDDLKGTGLTSFGEILQRVPFQSNAINTQSNNGGDGSVRMNLRGLASNRTLVLVNGRRHVAGGLGANSSVDLTAIPVAIIERVEILKDGASAVYGSDAVAGVVNIITRKDYDGTDANAYVGSTPDGLGTTYDVSATVGHTTKRGHIVFSAGYYEQQPIWARDRKFSRTDRAYDWETGEITSRGSTAVPNGYVQDRTGAGGNDTWQKVSAASAGDGTFYNDPQYGLRDFNFAGNSDVGEGDMYNYQPENYLITPNRRYNVFSAGSYDLTKSTRGFFEASYTNRRSEQKLASTPLYIISEGLGLSGDSVYNPYGRDFYDVRRRIVEADNRAFEQNINTFRFVTGLDGTLPGELPAIGSWYWNLSFNYGATEGSETNAGRFVRSRVANALGPSYYDQDGTARCGTPDAPIDGCTPLNLLGGAGTITDEMLDYISYVGVSKGYTRQMAMQLDVTGELFDIPWGDSANLAAGYELRRERGAYLPDPITASGDTTGNKGEPTEGGYHVNAGYMELSLPVITGAPAAEVVELTGAARLFDYNTFGTDYTWKVGARWMPVRDFSLRGTVSTAFRAPSVSEMYSGQYDSFPMATDPCDTLQGSRSEIVQANCSADGLPDDYTDDRNQLRSREGGNPNLNPETADIYTAGLVFQPRWVKGLSITADYFNITISNAIQPMGAEVLLSNCYAQANRSDCDRILRDSNGFITDIIDTEANIGGAETSGVDVSVHYNLGTRIGRFAWNADAVWLHEYNQIQATRTVEGKGVYDLGVFPDYRFNAGMTWTKNAVQAGVFTRYVGGFKECMDDDCSGDNPDRDVKSYATADVSGSYSFKYGTSQAMLTLGVNNVTNRRPPRVYNGFLATSDANSYDFFGRFMYMRLTLSTG